MQRTYSNPNVSNSTSTRSPCNTSRPPSLTAKVLFAHIRRRSRRKAKKQVDYLFFPSLLFHFFRRLQLPFCLHRKDMPIPILCVCTRVKAVRVVVISNRPPLLLLLQRQKHRNRMTHTRRRRRRMDGWMEWNGWKKRLTTGGGCSLCVCVAGQGHTHTWNRVLNFEKTGIWFLEQKGTFLEKWNQLIFIDFEVFWIFLGIQSITSFPEFIENYCFRVKTQFSQIGIQKKSQKICFGYFFRFWISRI